MADHAGSTHNSAATSGSITPSLPFAVVGPPGSSFPSNGDINAALTKAEAAGYRHLYIPRGTWPALTQYVPQHNYLRIEGEGPGITVIQPAASLTVACWSGLAQTNWTKCEVEHLTFSGAKQNSPAAAVALALTGGQATTLNGSVNSAVTTITTNAGFTGASGFYIVIDNEVMLVTAGGTGTSWTVTRAQYGTTAASHTNTAPVTVGVPYTHGSATFGTAATAPAYLQPSTGTFVAVGMTPVGGVLAGTNGLIAGSAAGTVAVLGASGLLMNLGDIALLFFNSSQSAQYQYSNEYLNVTSANYVVGTETANIFDLTRVEFTNNTHVGAVLAGTERSVAIWDGCEDSFILDPRFTTSGCFQAQMYNGSIEYSAGTMYQLAICGTENKVGVHVIGGGGFIYTNGGPQSPQQVDLYVAYYNGSKGSNYSLTFLNGSGAKLNCVINGGLIGATLSGGTAAGWISGAGVANTSFNFASSPQFVPNQVAATSPIFFGYTPLVVTGEFNVSNSGSFTNVNLSAGIGTSNYWINRVGVRSHWINGYLSQAPFQGTGGTGAATASTTGVMAGLASAGTSLTAPSVFVPASGSLKITISGAGTTATGSIAQTLGIRYGTGTPPNSGDAATGTATGGTLTFKSSAIGAFTPFTRVGYVTGLTPGTQIWADLVYFTTNASDSASLASIAALIEEIVP